MQIFHYIWGNFLFSLPLFIFVIESKRTMGHQLLQFTYDYTEFTFTFQSASATCQHLRSGVTWEFADFSRQNALQKLGVYTISDKIDFFFCTCSLANNWWQQHYF